jgi:hypothetical protein
MRRTTWLLALVFLGLLGAMAAKSLLVQVPQVGAQNTAGEFDANRAKARLAVILGDQKPHTSDTQADDLVRGRIVTLLRQMGLRPIVRDQLACNELYKQRGVSCARVRNVVAILGPTSGKALLLNAHYDSTPVGPAAADDGVGVATLLEVASILKDRPLKRPVMLLFNEGEELGLVGARAFLADPLSGHVDSLINLEARGVQGPVNMFETSRPNAPAIGVFSRAATHPVVNSLSTDVYRLMPNYTDVNSFSERGWFTLNFAPIGNETRYHSAGDNLSALDPATLQHMGDQTLAVARELANGTPSGSGDRIFMDVGGRTLIMLPLIVGTVLLVGLIVAFTIFSWKRGGIVRGAAVIVGTLLLSAALSWLVLTAIGVVRTGMFWRAHPLWTHLGVTSSTIFVAAALLASVGRGTEVPQLRAVFWLIYLLLGAIIGIVAPGGIVFFLFPPLILLLGIVVRRWWKHAERLASCLAILFLYLTWGAMLGLLEELLNSGPMWVFAPLGALILLPVLIEAKPMVDGTRLRGAAIVAGTLALIAWAGTAVAPAYSADRQQRFSIEHVTDADSGKAVWSVLNGGVPVPDAYRAAGKWRWAKLPYGPRKRWLADAPSLPGARAPSVEQVATVGSGTRRTITLRIRSNGAERISLIAPENARIRAAGTEGFVRPIDAAAEDGEYFISCSGRSCDGLTLEIVTDSLKPIEFIVLGAKSGLLPSAWALILKRPRFARPQYTPDQSIAFARVKL